MHKATHEFQHVMFSEPLC